MKKREVGRKILGKSRKSEGWEITNIGEERQKKKEGDRERQTDERN